MSQREGSTFTYPSLRGSTGGNTAVLDIWIHFSFEDSRLFDERFGMYCTNPHTNTKEEYGIQSLYLFKQLIYCLFKMSCLSSSWMLPKTLGGFYRAQDFQGWYLLKFSILKNTRKMFPQLTALLEMLFPIRNPTSY